MVSTAGPRPLPPPRPAGRSWETHHGPPAGAPTARVQQRSWRGGGGGCPGLSPVTSGCCSVLGLRRPPTAGPLWCGSGRVSTDARWTRWPARPRPGSASSGATRAGPGGEGPAGPRPPPSPRTARLTSSKKPPGIPPNPHRGSSAPAPPRPRLHPEGPLCRWPGAAHDGRLGDPVAGPHRAGVSGSGLCAATPGWGEDRRPRSRPSPGCCPPPPAPRGGMSVGTGTLLILNAAAHGADQEIRQRVRPASGPAARGRGGEPRAPDALPAAPRVPGGAGARAGAPGGTFRGAQQAPSLRAEGQTRAGLRSLAGACGVRGSQRVGSTGGARCLLPTCPAFNLRGKAAPPWALPPLPAKGQGPGPGHTHAHRPHPRPQATSTGHALRARGARGAAATGGPGPWPPNGPHPRARAVRACRCGHS